MRDEIFHIGVERVRPGQWQPRDREQITDESVAELAADIKRRGVLSPLLATPIEGVDGPMEVELIAGERRWRAARMAGELSVPVRLVFGTPDELHEMAIVDNLQREDLTLMEEARALQMLIDLHGYSQRELARRLSKSQGWVQQRLALPGLSSKVQEMVNTRVFSLAHARALSALPEAVQEVAAEHLDQVQASGVPLTSRQIQNLGRKVRKFLDPARFEGAEGRVMDPELRNGVIALRHLLRTLPEEQIGKAVGRLLEARPGSEEQGLLGRKELRRSDTDSLLSLLMNPGEWRGFAYYSKPVWPDEVAIAMGRTCLGCVFVGHEGPKLPYSNWRSPCARWRELETAPVSCAMCTLESDAVVIPNAWEFKEIEDAVIREDGDFPYVESVSEYVRLVEEAGRRQREHKVNKKADERNEHHEWLVAFRTRCEEALGLDVEHFQAQWCGRCARGQGDCDLMAKPIGNSWERRPYLSAMVEIEECEDNDGKPYRMAGRVVPRCELFQFVSVPILHQIGWLMFSKEKRERRDTVIRWLRAMVRGVTRQGNGSLGVWSPLRWLPYKRARDKHYDREKLLSYVLANWNKWGDAQVGTLLNVAASECVAANRQGRRPVFALYNPETGVEEHWACVRWEASTGEKPGWGSNWPDDIEWPFLKSGGE